MPDSRMAPSTYFGDPRIGDIAGDISLATFLDYNHGFYPNGKYVQEERKEAAALVEAKKKTEPAGNNKPKVVIELKVPLCCETCARKVKRKIEKLDGVETPVICDLYERKVTVKASTEPETVLKQVQKVKKDSAMWLKKEPADNSAADAQLPLDEDDLMSKLALSIRKNVEEAINLTVLPLVSALRIREEDEQKHREKLLALEVEKLALKREKLLFKRRRCQLQGVSRSTSSSARSGSNRHGLRLKVSARYFLRAFRRLVTLQHGMVGWELEKNKHLSNGVCYTLQEVDDDAP